MIRVEVYVTKQAILAKQDCLIATQPEPLSEIRVNWKNRVNQKIETNFFLFEIGFMNW